jgi:alpha-tubulin suppressor-like RCC1 family protein
MADDRFDPDFEKDLAGELADLADEATRPFDAAQISRAAIGRAGARTRGPIIRAWWRPVLAVALLAVGVVGVGVVGGFIKLPNNDLHPNPSFQPFTPAPSGSQVPIASPSSHGPLPPTVIPVTPSPTPVVTPPPVTPPPTPTPTPPLTPSPSVEPSPSGEPTPSPSPTIAPVESVVAMAAGGWHDCFLAEDGRVFCDGTNESGELGDGTQNDRDHPNVPVVGIDDATAVAVGTWSSCAVRQDGSVWCWGLGPGTENTSLVPVQVAGIDDAQAVVMGQEFACALRAGGSVACWGKEWFGQLGNGLTDEVRVAQPQQVIGIDNAVAITAGFAHACALLADHTIHCWGDNGQGQLGDGTQDITGLATEVVGIEDAVEVNAGGLSTCAIRSDRSVWCWGDGRQGQLGDGRGASSLTPVRVQAIDDATTLAVGFHHACAARSNDSVWCWGDTSWASPTGGPAFIPVEGNKTASLKPILLSSARQSVLVIDDRGRVWSWGFGTSQRPQRWRVGP